MSTTSFPTRRKSSGHPCWEEDVYAKGRHLNLYPYHAVVGFVMRRYAQVADRAAVRILELGFGAGNNLWFAAREGFSVAGVEGAPTAVAFARRRFNAEGLSGDLREGHVGALPWGDAEFDMVLDRMTLCHTTAPVFQAALTESRRVLKVGGRMLSVNYSHAHPGRESGRPLGNNDYDAFTGGYFCGLGTVHFCDRDEIDTLFGSRFSITSLVQTMEEEELAGRRAVNAFWKVECLKDVT